MATRKLEVQVIGDTSQLEGELRQLRAELKRLQGAGKDAGAGTDEAGAGSGRMAAAMTRAKRAAGQLAGIAGVAGVAGATVGAVKSVAGFETSLNTLQAVSGASAREMKAAATEAKRLGGDARLPATSAADAASAMTELAKGGLDVKQSMSAARGVLQLSAAAQVDNATAATITARALNAFGLKGKEATRVADLLAGAANASTAEIDDIAQGMQQASSMAKQMGVPIEDLTTALGLMANAGISGSDAGTSIKTMLMRMVPQTDKAAEAMRKLGIDVFDSNGKFIGIRAAAAQYTKALKPLNQEQRAQALQTIFGSDAQRAANILLGQGTKQFDAMKQSVTKTGNAQKMAEAKTKGLAGAWDGLKSNLETIAIGALQPLLPVLTGVVRGLSAMTEALGAVPGVIGAVVGWFRRGGTVVSAVTAAIGTLAAVGTVALLPWFAATANALIFQAAWTIRAAAGWIKMNAAVLANPFLIAAVALAALVAGIVVAYKESETFRRIVNSVWNALKTAAGVIFPFIGSAITTAWNVAKTVTTTTWGAIKTATTATWGAIKTVTNAAWNTIKGYIVNPIGDAVGFVVDKFNGLKKFLSDTWNAIKRGFHVFGLLLENTAARAFGGVANVIIGFVNAIIDAINWVLDKVGAGKIKKIDKVKVPEQMSVRDAQRAAGVPGLARGGIARHPMVMVGEEAPRHEEYVIPTNPAYRSRAHMLMADLAGKIGLPGFAEGGVISAFREAIKRTGAGPKASLALWMAGWVESRYRNLPYGDRDSLGALQVRAGLHGKELAMNPLASAIAFLTRGFYGYGGAISLAKRMPHLTAGQVAQLVQGSAFPDRYDAARSIAERYWKGGGGSSGFIDAIGNAVSGAFDAVGDILSGALGMLPSLPKLPPGMQFLAGIPKFVLSKAKDYLGSLVGGLFGGGGEATGAKVGKGVSGSIEDAIKVAAALGFSRPNPNQLTGGRHAAQSYHYRGRAADFGDAGHTREQMALLFTTLLRKFGSHIKELFYDPMGFYIQNGQRVPGAIGGHGDHVHIALARGGVIGLPFAGSFQNGGVVPRTGMALVHQGERITPAGGGGPLVHIEHLEVHDRFDEERLAYQLARLVETA